MTRNFNINFVVVALLLTSSWANIIVNLTDGTYEELEGYQIFYRGGSVEPLNDTVTAPISMDVSTVDQKIFVIHTGSPIEDIIVQAQNNGAIAVVVASSDSVVGGTLQYRWNSLEIASQVNITVIDVGYVEVGAGLGSERLAKLATNGKIANLTLLPDERLNPWVVTYSSGWIHAWNVFFIAFSTVNIIMATLQLKKFVGFYGGCTQSIAIYVLSIEIVSNLIRVICCFDFFGSNYLYPDWAGKFLKQIFYPFVIASFLLFTLYWHEMMTSASIIVHPFIVKMRIPFFVISGFILAVQVVITIVQTLTDFTQANIITAAFYLGSFIFIIVWYSVTGIKLLLRLRKSQHLGRTVNLKKSTIKVLISGSFVLVFVALAILFVTGIPWSPILLPIIWFITIGVVNAASLMNILAFELPGKWSSKSKSNGSASMKTTSNAMELNQLSEP